MQLFTKIKSIFNCISKYLKEKNKEDEKEEPAIYQIEKEDAQFAYENLVKIRNLEIDSLWKRITVMFAIQAILFSVLSSDYMNLSLQPTLFQIAFIFFGFLTSIISIIIIQGSSWWVKHWENEKLAKLERYIGVDDYEIFRNHPPYNLEKQTSGYHSNRKWIKGLFLIITALWGIILFLSVLSILGIDTYPILLNQTKTC